MKFKVGDWVRIKDCGRVCRIVKVEDPFKYPYWLELETLACYEDKELELVKLYKVVLTTKVLF